MIEYEICICIVLTLIIQKDLKVWLVKLHNLTQTETKELNCIEPLSMKMLSVLFLINAQVPSEQGQKARSRSVES